MFLEQLRTSFSWSYDEMKLNDTFVAAVLMGAKRAERKDRLLASIQF